MRLLAFTTPALFNLFTISPISVGVIILIFILTPTCKGRRSSQQQQQQKLFPFTDIGWAFHFSFSLINFGSILEIFFKKSIFYNFFRFGSRRMSHGFEEFGATTLLRIFWWRAWSYWGSMYPVFMMDVFVCFLSFNVSRKLLVYPSFSQQSVLFKACSCSPLFSSKAWQQILS